MRKKDAIKTFTLLYSQNDVTFTKELNHGPHSKLPFAKSKCVQKRCETSDPAPESHGRGGRGSKGGES